MLAVTLALTLLAQGPGSTHAWAMAGPEPAGGTTVTIVGDLELSRGEAQQSAMVAARQFHLERLRQRGEELADRFAPFWLPEFVVEPQVDAWVARAERSTPVAVADRETETFDYSYGEAFRTTLQVESATALDRDAEYRMERGLRQLGRLLLAKLGGIAVFWGLLAFLSSWFDRLTRGYMSWRLRLIALGLGLVASTVVLLA